MAVVALVPMIKLATLKVNQQNPRRISAAKLEALKKSLADFPKMMKLRPIIVDEHFTVLGGNQRHAACTALGMTEIPDEWVKQASDLTEEEKREFIIKDNLPFGEWDFDILLSWDQAQLLDWGFDLMPDKTQTEYSRKITAPIYEPKNRKPDTSELYDRTQVMNKMEMVEALRVPPDVRQFLREAAARFTRFNFALIADFYAHADPALQEVMESLALVIIDYDKAIEYGFVRLVKETTEAVKDDYDE
jgi:ParB/Sulfiredoxin domain